MSWDLEFEHPVPLPTGKTAWTLREAATFVRTLPQREAVHERWQVAVEALIMAAENRGPVMHARIGMLMALNKDKPKPEPIGRKDQRWAKRRLARDQ
jgi:hypothetical protein